MYDYKKEIRDILKYSKPELEVAKELYEKYCAIVQNINAECDRTGYVTLNDAMGSYTGSNWTIMAIIDFIRLEYGYIELVFEPEPGIMSGRNVYRRTQFRVLDQFDFITKLFEVVKREQEA